VFIITYIGWVVPDSVETKTKEFKKKEKTKERKNELENKAR